jgi:hypothetical protein
MTINSSSAACKFSEAVTRFGDRGLGRGQRFVEDGERLLAPIMPLVVAIEQPDQRAGIHQIANRRNLQWSKDLSVRTSPSQPRDAPIPQTTGLCERLCA